MFDLDPSTIPAWFVGAIMIYTGLIWLISRTKRIRMDSRIFATPFLIWGLVYGVVFQFFDISIEARGFLSRFMLVMLSISQGLPLTISYIRSIKRGD